MIHTIVFDIGEVLAHFRWREYIEDFHYDVEISKKLIYATVEDIDHWSIQDKGAISDDAFVEKCIERAPDIEDEIRSFFEHIEAIVEEFDYAADLVKQLKENGYQVLLLSNYGYRTFEYAKKKFKFLEHVDGGVISSHVKMIKPNQDIYLELIHKYQLDPSKTVFLDDRLDNVEAAKSLGFHTVHFKGYDQGIEELRQLNVLIEKS